MKKLFLMSSTILCIMVLVGCGSAATVTSDEVKILQEYYQALSSDDIDTAMSYVADDAVFIDPMGKYVGKENIRAVYEPQMNRGGSWEPSNIKDTNGKGYLSYDFYASINDVGVYSGTGFTVIKDRKIVFDGTESNWKGECKRDPSQSFCSD